jgi:hypothetical protein
MATPSREFVLQDITAKHIMETVEAGWTIRKDGVDVSKVVDYVHISLAYARRALTDAVQLGMMSKDDKRYRTVDAAELVSKASKDQWPALFGKFLVAYAPFVLFVAQVARGDSPEVAGRKVSAVYGLGTDAGTTRKVLTEWGIYAGVLEEGADGLMTIKVNVQTLDAKTVEQLGEAVKSELNTRVYVANRLGDEASMAIVKSVDFLVAAILKHQSDPRSSIEDSGRAFEDFLRSMCESKGIGTNSLNGIGMLADALNSGNYITDKHHAICLGINAIRIAAAHGRDKKIKGTWNISAETAMETALLCLSMIKSLFQYANAAGLLL